MNTLIQEKCQQAIRVLKKTGVDAWLTLVRETSCNRDPVLPLIFGDGDLTWLSAFLFTRSGERIAILGRYEAEIARRTGAYDQVLFYDESIQPLLIETLSRIDPQQLAVNTSLHDIHADGLSHGLYRLLLQYLEATPYHDRLIESSPVVSALRGRKSREEIRRIRAAVAETADIFDKTIAWMQVGMTEIQVSEFMHAEMAARGLDAAWTYESCPAVNTGPESPVGHSGPTDLVIEPGHIVHFDFGVKKEGYCSDMQRVVYFLRPGETAAPAEVQRGFDTVRDAVKNAVNIMRPGIAAYEVDEAARSTVTGAGYPSYQYSTGHQLGRLAHDGGASLSARWERYGDLPYRLIESNQVYTVEPGLPVPGYGYIGLEEDVLVTAAGAGFLWPPQTRLILKQS